MIMKKYIARFFYVVFLLFVGISLEKYRVFIQANNSEELSEKEKIALTARFVYMYNCTNISGSLTGENVNSLFQSKILMQLSAFCAQDAEKISNYILTQPESFVTTNNLVNLIDQALSLPKNDSSKKESETTPIEKHSEQVNNFI